MLLAGQAKLIVDLLNIKGNKIRAAQGIEHQVAGIELKLLVLIVQIAQLAPDILGRVAVQQAFVKAMAKQCLRPSGLLKLGGVLRLLSNDLVTNLSMGNLGYLGLKLLRMDELRTDTMPGSADGIYLDGQNYYVIYGLDTLALLNEAYSPLQSEITLADVEMMRLSGQAIVYADGTYYASVP